jgi:hypothetical protein
MMPSITSTRRALMPSGGLNALTALDTASMPVSEEPPLANERIRLKITTNRATPWIPEPMWTVPEMLCTFWGCRFPMTSRSSPTTIIRRTTLVNR